MSGTGVGSLEVLTCQAFEWIPTMKNGCIQEKQTRQDTSHKLIAIVRLDSQSQQALKVSAWGLCLNSTKSGRISFFTGRVSGASELPARCLHRWDFYKGQFRQITPRLVVWKVTVHSGGLSLERRSFLTQLREEAVFVSGHYGKSQCDPFRSNTQFQNAR